MTLSITIAELRTHHACDLSGRVGALTDHIGRPVGDDEPVPLTTWAAVTSYTPDLLWALRCCWGRGGRAVGVEVACRAAERALVHARPDAAPTLRAAIDAARGVVAGTHSAEDARKAALAAANAAAAAYAAAADDYAANVANAAANVAANAAYAADDDYTAADAAYAHATAAAAGVGGVASERAAQRADLLTLLEVIP